VIYFMQLNQLLSQMQAAPAFNTGVSMGHVHQWGVHPAHCLAASQPHGCIHLCRSMR